MLEQKNIFSTYTLNLLYFYKLLIKVTFGLSLQIFVIKNKIYIITTRQLLFALLIILKKSSLFQLTLFLNLAVSDLIGKSFRFRLCYTLRSPIYGIFIDVITYTNEILAIPSISNMYKNSIWMEREIWDSFGILFINNKNLMRIMNDYGFKGHPFRKDFPLIGFDELIYNEITKKIKIYAVETASEYKLYNWHAIWK